MITLTNHMSTSLDQTPTMNPKIHTRTPALLVTTQRRSRRCEMLTGSVLSSRCLYLYNSLVEHKGSSWETKKWSEVIGLKHHSLSFCYVLSGVSFTVTSLLMPALHRCPILTSLNFMLKVFCNRKEQCWLFSELAEANIPLTGIEP